MRGAAFAAGGSIDASRQLRRVRLCVCVSLCQCVCGATVLRATPSAIIALVADSPKCQLAFARKAKQNQTNQTKPYQPKTNGRVAYQVKTAREAIPMTSETVLMRSKQSD